jgi:hypothetical protein
LLAARGVLTVAVGHRRLRGGDSFDAVLVVVPSLWVVNQEAIDNGPLGVVERFIFERLDLVVELWTPLAGELLAVKELSQAPGFDGFVVIDLPGVFDDFEKVHQQPVVNGLMVVRVEIARDDVLLGSAQIDVAPGAGLADAVRPGALEFGVVETPFGDQHAMKVRMPEAGLGSALDLEAAVHRNDLARPAGDVLAVPSVVVTLPEFGIGGLELLPGGGQMLVIADGERYVMDAAGGALGAMMEELRGDLESLLAAQDGHADCTGTLAAKLGADGARADIVARGWLLHEEPGAALLLTQGPEGDPLALVVLDAVIASVGLLVTHEGLSELEADIGDAVGVLLAFEDGFFPRLPGLPGFLRKQVR